ncbi:CLC_0170 family protein [Clostridium sp. DJ247]|uniref:CLC_0170 family protein n=1 Tax=Clostridium sp. DJ247 TaxID=2726188 RepID=UPI0016262C21|nr:CLC_0170 family protein [Clostridium sp. DJ247]MBC2579891.1 hypothetical protein [Clostridium sp. DJ247]
MRLIRLFDKYFLILMVIQGFVVGFIDSRRFKNFKINHMARKAKIIGRASIVVALTLYLITKYIA